MTAAPKFPNDSTFGFPNGTLPSFISNDALPDQTVLGVFWYILPWFIMLVGVPGNVLSIIVLSVKKLRRTSTAVFLMSLAIVDLLVVISAIFRFKSFRVFYIHSDFTVGSPFDIPSFEKYSQVYFEPVFTICATTSNLILMALTLERYLVVRFPFSTVKLKPEYAGLVSVCLLCFSAVVHLPVDAMYEIHTDEFPFGNLTFVVVKLREYGELHSTLRYRCLMHHYFDPIIFFIVPWVVLCVCNTLLFLHVVKSAKIRSERSAAPSANRHLSILLLVIVLGYAILNLPYVILCLVKISDEYLYGKTCEDNPEGGNIEELQGKALERATVAALTLSTINNAINFILYCISGAKIRAEFKRLITCKKSTPMSATASMRMTASVRTTVSSVSIRRQQSNDPTGPSQRVTEEGGGRVAETSFTVGDPDQRAHDNSGLKVEGDAC